MPATWRFASGAVLVATWLAAGGDPAEACTLSIPTVNIGTYTGVLLQGGATNVTVNCGFGQRYVIPLNAGTRVGATVTTRQMTNGTRTLNYQLFADAGRATNWGNSAGTGARSGTGNNGNQIFTIYPQIAAGQLLTQGTYKDTITATTTGGSPNASMTFVVQATVVPNCSISATTLSFGVYTGAKLDATSTLSVKCTNSTPYYVNLSDGMTRDGSYYPRMTGPQDALVSYRLSQNAARTIEWRNTYNYDGQNGTGTGLTQVLTVYGSVLAGQSGPPGLYSDTIVATVTY